MTIFKFIVILPFLCLASDAGAQAFAQETASGQWELTLDGIKSKAQSLMVEHNGLQIELRQLEAQALQLRQAIEEQESKNGKVSRFLKERQGHSDQQLDIWELTRALKVKKQELREAQAHWADLRKKQAKTDREQQRLRRLIASQNTTGDDLSQWRRQLEAESRQEVLLENELKELQTRGTQSVNVDAIDEENKQLGARLAMLQSQKSRYEKKPSRPDNERRYRELKTRKEELEADINAYETHLDQLRESSMTGLSWQARKKKLIHEMVQADAHNNQMRDNIKVLREDIDVLRDQVAKLERRVNFVQNK